MCSTIFGRYKGPVAAIVAALAAGALCGDAWAPPREADLRLALAPDRPAAAVGEAVVFTAAVHNAGPDSALEVVVVGRLPVGVTLLRAVPSQGRCDGATCDLGIMGRQNAAHDARATVRYVARVDAPGTLVASADVSSRSLALEITPENNAAESSLAATPFAGARPAAALRLQLASVRKRVVVARVLSLGPDPAERVAVTGRGAIGTLDVGAERAFTVRYRRAGRYVLRAASSAPAASATLPIRVR